MGKNRQRSKMNRNKRHKGIVKNVSNTREIIETENYCSSVAEFSDRINSIYGDMKSKLTSSYEELSKVDLEITDINHYIEMSKLDAYRGYNAYVMLRDRLVKRRKIKDEIYYLKNMINKSQEFDAKSKGFLMRIDHQKYEPRAIGELFK